MEGEREVSEESESSEGTLQGELISAGFMMTAEHLDRLVATTARAVLEANRDSMASLVASLPYTHSVVPSSPSSRGTHIKPPRWTDDDTPHEYFQKFEKAMRHNKIDQGEWGSFVTCVLNGQTKHLLHRWRKVLWTTMRQ